MSAVEVLNIEDYWSSPAINWFDYFVDRVQFSKLLEDPGNNKDLLVRLAIQFAEQALASEREKDMLTVKMFPAEDVKFVERKSASLWLCSLSAIAALDWDFDLLLSKSDILSVRPIVDYITKIYQNREITTDSAFGDWLAARWILLVDLKFLITPPPAKQSVNNPGLVADTNLLRHENIRKLVIETRERLRNAVSCLEQFVQDAQSLFVPGIKCFFMPFCEVGGKSMNIGIAGENVLVDGPPKPNLTLQCDHLSGKEVTNKTSCILADHYFAARNLLKAKEHLLKISSITPKHSLLTFDCDIISSYCVALGLPSPFPLQGTSRDDYTNPNICENDHNSYRKWRSRRLQSYRQSSGEAKLIFEQENTAMDIVGRVPTFLPIELPGPKMTFVAKSVVRQMAKVPPSRLHEIVGCVNYICGTINGFKEAFITFKFSQPLRGYSASVAYPASSLPAGAAINKMMDGNNPFWTILTSFDVAEIKIAYNSGRPQFFPFTYAFPTMLCDVIDLNRNFDLSWFLLGKLEQLARQRSDGWQGFLNMLMSEIGQTIDQTRVLFEAIHVLNSKYNSTLSLPWHPIKESELIQHVLTLQNLLEKVLLPPSAPPRFSLQALAMYINKQDWVAALQFKGENMAVLQYIQVLCSYAYAVSNPQNQIPIVQLIEAWQKQVSPLFEGPTNKRRNDGAGHNYRQNLKLKQELLQFLLFIKEPVSLSFLISYFAHLLNRVFTADRKPQLRLFVQHADLLGRETDFTNAHQIAIQEFFHTLLLSGLAVSPNNPHWLRTAGDLHYACGEVSEALARYVECLLSCRQLFTSPFPDSIINDSFWQKVRCCLVSSSYNTLACLVGQFLKEKKHSEIVKSVEIASQSSVDDREECAYLVHDPLLLEALSQAYWTNNQFNSADRLMQCASSSSINMNNRPEIYSREKARKEERLLRILASLTFDTGH